jgi:hypothetical protein
VVGNVYDSAGKVRYTIDGKWTESLSAYPCNENGSEMKDRSFKLWTKNPLPSKSEKQYNFTLVFNSLQISLFGFFSNWLTSF